MPLSKAVMGVAKSVTSNLRMRRSGRRVSMKSTSSRPPCSCISITALGSDTVITTRPSPAPPRRKSTFSMARSSVRDPPPPPPCAVETAVADSRSPPRPATVSTTWLSTTRRSYGEAATRFTTTRVRPPASTALTLRTLPTPTLMDLRSSSLLVPSKSRAIRAGLSVLKARGRAAGPAVVNTSCTLSPGRAAKSMAVSALAPSTLPGARKSQIRRLARRPGSTSPRRAPDFAAPCTALPGSRVWLFILEFPLNYSDRSREA